MNRFYSLLLLFLVFTLNTIAQSPVLVKDINPGSGDGQPFTMAVYNDLLFFGADDTAYNKELWVSDGTEAGTYLFKEIRPGKNKPSSPSNYVVLGDKLYFSASDETHNVTLYVTDGTPGGTTAVKEVNSPRIEHQNYIQILNGKMFFSADENYSDSELWTSDGTSSGTFILKDIYPGENGSEPRMMKVINGLLFFYANDGEHGYEPWVSNGTADGTFMLKDINPGPEHSNQLASFRFAEYQGKAYFIANDPEHGAEVWLTDGSTEGTLLLKDIVQGPNSSTISGTLHKFYEYHGFLYFMADDGVHGAELWRTDGTNTGTILDEDIIPGQEGSFPNQFHIYNEKLYFNAYTSNYGMELCVKNGAAGNTTMLKDINPGEGSGGATFLSNYGGKIYFKGYDEINGLAVWTSDGTNEGTYMIEPVSGSNYNPLGNVSFFGFYYYKGSIYYGANYDDKGKELYKLDVSATGINTPNEKSLTFKVYPNPIKEVLSVNFESTTSSNIKLCLYTITGQTILKTSAIEYKPGNHHIHLNIPSELPAGVYLLNLQSNDISRSVKLIKK